MKPKQLSVHIDELRLHGFSPADRLVVGAEVERTLATLIAHAGLSPALQTASQIDALPRTTYQAPAHASPAAVGAAVARALHGRLSR